MKTHSICLFVWFISHNVISFQSIHVVQVARFHFFTADILLISFQQWNPATWTAWVDLNDIMLYETNDSLFFIHLSINGHLGCFHILDTVNNAVMNIGVHISFWNSVFVFCW